MIDVLTDLERKRDILYSRVIQEGSAVRINSLMGKPSDPNGNFSINFRVQDGRYSLNVGVTQGQSFLQGDEALEEYRKLLETEPVGNDQYSKLARLVGRAFFQEDIEGNIFRFLPTERVSNTLFSLQGNVSQGFTKGIFECTETIGLDESGLYTGIRVFLVGPYSGRTTQFDLEGQKENPMENEWVKVRDTNEDDELIMQASLSYINNLCIALGERNPFRTSS